MKNKIKRYTDKIKSGVADVLSFHVRTHYKALEDIRNDTADAIKKKRQYNENAKKKGTYPRY